MQFTRCFSEERSQGAQSSILQRTAYSKSRLRDTGVNSQHRRTARTVRRSNSSYQSSPRTMLPATPNLRGGRAACPVRCAGCGNGATVEPLRHRQTKGAETDMSDLQQPRHISTLPSTSVRRAATIFPESEVDRTRRGHSENGAHDPNADIEPRFP